MPHIFGEDNKDQSGSVVPGESPRSCAADVDAADLLPISESISSPVIGRSQETGFLAFGPGHQDVDYRAMLQSELSVSHDVDYRIMPRSLESTCDYPIPVIADNDPRKTSRMTEPRSMESMGGCPIPVNITSGQRNTGGVTEPQQQPVQVYSSVCYLCIDF